QFIRRTNQWGITNGVHLVLQLLEEWTDIHIPPTVMRSLTPAAPDAVTIGRARDRILNGSSMTSKHDVARVEGKARITDILAALRGALFASRLVLAEEY